MKKNILIVENYQSIRKILILALKKLTNYIGNIYIVNDINDIKDIVNKIKIDIIFADIELSDMPDYYIGKFLKENGLDIPLYYISTSEINESIISNAKENNGYGIIEPLRNIKDLFIFIEKIITDPYIKNEFLLLNKKTESTESHDLHALNTKLKEMNMDYEKIIMELNELVIQLMIDLQREKEKVKFWEKAIKEYKKITSNLK